MPSPEKRIDQLEFNTSCLHGSQCVDMGIPDKHGEFFIRWVVAYDICARVAGGATLEAAADSVIKDILVEAGGDGGVIAMDPAGNIAMPFNTPGMYRASIDVHGNVVVAIYGDE